MSTLLVLLLFHAPFVFSSEYKYGNINTCGVKYVKPGDDFSIACKTDHGTLTRMFTPTPAELHSIPSNDVIEQRAFKMSKNRDLIGERSTTINEYEDATKGEDDGLYTCLVYHGYGHDPHFSKATCLVVIKDLCEDAGCREDQICEADYDAGTTICKCDEACPDDFDPVCSNRCEQFINECLMNLQTCKDMLPREVASKLICPAVVAPVLRAVDDEIMVDYYEETVVLTSGVVMDGTPAVTTVWEFYHEDGSDPITFTPSADPYELTVDENSVGMYRVTVLQCMDEESAVVSEYRVSVEEEEFEEEFNLPKFYHTCSVFPGGAIEGFNGQANYYDMACTHVLAADFRPSGDYTHPWFIYGTFDQHDGKTALSQLSFHMGQSSFQVERGWIVHQHGAKMQLEQWEMQNVGDTGCTVVFEHFHLTVDCPPFKVLYDGVMSGHIIMKPVVEAPYPALQKKSGNVGLCYDNNSGFRPNWQVGNTAEKCEIDTTETPCNEVLEECNLSQVAAMLPGYSNLQWTECGNGASVGCGELRCEGNTPSDMQLCALEQAKRVSCSLKYGQDTDLAASDVSCPEDPCEWMKLVEKTGCPQEHPPHNCV